jgi:hypothetical protein
MLRESLYDNFRVKSSLLIVSTNDNSSPYCCCYCGSYNCRNCVELPASGDQTLYNFMQNNVDPLNFEANRQLFDPNFCNLNHVNGTEGLTILSLEVQIDI